MARGPPCESDKQTPVSPRRSPPHRCSMPRERELEDKGIGGLQPLRGCRQARGRLPRSTRPITIKGMPTTTLSAGWAAEVFARYQLRRWRTRQGLQAAPEPARTAIDRRRPRLSGFALASPSMLRLDVFSSERLTTRAELGEGGRQGLLFCSFGRESRCGGDDPASDQGLDEGSPGAAIVWATDTPGNGPSWWFRAAYEIPARTVRPPERDAVAARIHRPQVLPAPIRRSRP